MKDKDFSEIIKLIRTNGVGFVKCYFRSGLYPEDLLDSASDYKEWRIDFSDGINYLGSLYTTTEEFGDHDTDPKNEKIVSECTLYLGKMGELKRDICLYLSFYPGLLIQGECIIATQSLNLE
jgi:hypothetical protein